MLSKGNLEVLQKTSKDPELAVLDEEAGKKKQKGPERAGEKGEKKEGLVKAEESKKDVETVKTLEELQAALDKARADLARKKGELKDFEMLFVGRLKGMIHGERKANIQKEYDEFLKKYQEARVQYVVGDVSKLTEERMKLTEALVEAKGENKEHFLYKGYKWLGDQNVAKLFGEKFNLKLSDDFQEKHPLLTGVARIAGKFLSVRTALSLGLLGAGLMTGAGAGLAVGMGILTGRALMRGVGTAAGSHDLLKAIGATAWESKGKFQIKKEEPWYKKVSLWEKITPEEIGKMSKEKIEERLANMETNALLHNKKVSESDVYKQLLQGYESKMQEELEKRGDSAKDILANFAKESDTKRTELEKSKRIKHEVTVSVLTAAMVILPGLHQFQRVIEKNAVEWTAATKGAKEALNMPAAEAHPMGRIDVPAMTKELINKTVKFATEGAEAKHAQPITIEDLQHIRNIASHATPEGNQMKSLLAYIDKNNLLEQSGIKAVTLEGNHATPYAALQEAAVKNPEYFKDISVDQRALELAKLHNVTVEQLKTLSHPREALYISKDGVIMTQNEAVVGHGVINRAHETVGRVATVGAATEQVRQTTNIGTTTEGSHERVVRHARGVQHPRPAPMHEGDTRQAVQEAMQEKSPARPPAEAARSAPKAEQISGKGEMIFEDTQGRGTKVDIAGGKVQEVVIKEVQPQTSGAEAAQSGEASVQPKLEVRVEGTEGAAATPPVEVPHPPGKVEGVAQEVEQQPISPQKIELDARDTISATTKTWKPSFEVVRETDGSIKGIVYKAPDTFFNQQGYGFAKTADYIQRYEEFQGRSAPGIIGELFRDVQPLEVHKITKAMEAYQALRTAHPAEAQWILDHDIREQMNKLASMYGKEFFNTDKMPESVKTALAEDVKKWPSMQDLFPKVQHGQDPLGTVVIQEGKKYHPFGWKLPE